jgi:hypothetical protein
MLHGYKNLQKLGTELELRMVFLFKVHSAMRLITLSHRKGTAGEVWIAAISHEIDKINMG